jgi:hypothetical protein
MMGIGDAITPLKNTGQIQTIRGNPNVFFRSQKAI